MTEAASRSNKRPEDDSETGSASSSIHSQDRGGSARDESFVEVSSHRSSGRQARSFDLDRMYRKVNIMRVTRDIALIDPRADMTRCHSTPQAKKIQ